MVLSLRPITFRDACTFVKEHHRHHKPPQGPKASVAVEDDGRLCGVAVVGHLVSRHRITIGTECTPVHYPQRN